MATGSPSAKFDNGPHRTVITVVVVVVLVSLIVFVSFCVRKHSPERRLREVHLQQELRRSGYRRRHRRSLEKGIPASLLQSIPLVQFKALWGHRDANISDLEGNHGQEKQVTTRIKTVVAPKNGRAETEAKETIPPSHHDSQVTNDLRELEQSECAICTQHFQQEEWLRLLPCSHAFHSHCIDKWLLDFGDSCPIW
jgi:RING finger protein 165